MIDFLVPVSITLIRTTEVESKDFWKHVIDFVRRRPYKSTTCFWKFLSSTSVHE